MKFSKQNLSQQVLVILSILSAAVFNLTGCSSAGGKVVIGDAQKPVEVSYVAFLPIEHPVGVRAERVDRTRELVAGELRNKGLLLVDDQLVESVCSSPACPEWKTLFSRYHVDAVADLKLNSVQNGDFYLGRYSNISGALELKSKAGQTMYKVENTTRQTGGLLFNTGAVVQAVKTLSTSLQDATFDPLAAKFARDLLANVEFARNDNVAASLTDLEIHGVTVADVSPLRKKLCVQATANNLLTITSSSLVSDLTEVSPGNYCAVYPARNIPMIEQYTAQLRTPSGIVVTKTVGRPIQTGRL